jgi:secondary thiamine-phosphate synthase enzyme
MEITIKTKNRNEMINITEEVEKIVKNSGIKEGICIVYCPHTTAAITINENSDHDVVDDLIMGLNKIVDSDWPFKHAEGNSDAHLKSSLVGCEKTIIIEKGNLKLGMWQAIYFCEFDGPRQRRVDVKVI